MLARTWEVKFKVFMNFIMEQRAVTGQNRPLEKAFAIQAKPNYFVTSTRARAAYSTCSRDISGNMGMLSTRSQARSACGSDPG